ncbi:putative RibB-like alpha/beta DHBP synthase [Chloropicon primus]|nr:putative RibB-like alpha/beta DHBP synthase [Chloropicon primus]
MVGKVPNGGVNRGALASAVGLQATCEDRVLVRKADGEDEMTIQVALPPAGRMRNMCRKKDEAIAKPLERIRRTVSSACLGNQGGRERKKSRGEHSAAASDVAADLGVSCTILDRIGKPVPETTTNSEAWQTGYTLELKYTLKEENAGLLEKKLRIETNLPACSEISLPKRVVAGDIVTSPYARLEFCSRGDCKWLWYVESEKGWELVAEGKPDLAVDEQHVGKRIKIKCEPACGGRLGEPREAVSVEPVMGAPRLEFMKARHERMARSKPDTSLRIMTYNILADVYSKTDYARDVLFPEIAPEHLDTGYRQQLSLFEIGGFASDVVCLQEMDTYLYDKFWSPRLESMGYSGFFGPKTSKAEGCALFWKSGRLSAIGKESIHIRDYFGDEQWLEQHLGVGVGRAIASDPNLAAILKKISTAAQFVLLEENDSKRKILVTNTHLYFHPGASHVRSLSVAVMLAYASDLLSRHKLLGDCVVLICGDLNSEPDTGAIELLAKGSVSREHYEWLDCLRFSWKGRDEEAGFEQDEELKYELDAGSALGGEAVTGFYLKNPFGPLTSADGLRSSFTNYVKGYIGALDYIFFNPQGMKLEDFAPLPLERDLCREEDVDSEGRVLKQGYLPSQAFPSDHVSLVADFSFLDASGATATGGVPLAWPPPEDREVMPLPASRWNEGKAADALRQGKIIAVPTDTIYGVAAAASSDEGIDRIYDAKQRPAFLPLALCIAHASEIGRYGEASHLPGGLVEEFLPGPYTLLLNRKEDSELSKNLNPGTKTVGIRVPESSFVRGVVSQLGFAIALTSANISGGQSSTAVGHFREIWSKCANVYDGGSLNAGTSGSTIIDLTQEGVYKIVRKGCSEAEARSILERYGINEQQ